MARGGSGGSFGDLTAAALAGDEEAWRVLCGRLTNVVWKTINGFQLGRHDAQDAFAATFFRLAEHQALLAAERAGALWTSFAKLSSRCQGLLRLLIVEPRPSYEEIGMALGMPIGSIGPTRARCLTALRALL